MNEHECIQVPQLLNHCNMIKKDIYIFYLIDYLFSHIYCLTVCYGINNMLQLTSSLVHGRNVDPTEARSISFSQ